MSMRACLVSHNAEVVAVLTQCNGIVWEYTQPGKPLPEASLYIWDYEQNLEIPSDVLAREDTQHLLLTDGRHLDAVECYRASSVGIMLKPATPFTLKAFVEMALKTWTLRRQVREANVLRHDRDALLQYVFEVNLKLQEYDQERSNFLARALHDLRAPLTALHGYCGLLAEGRLGPVNSQQRELLERMSYSTSRLGRLASGAFDLLIEGRIERAPKLRAGDIEESVSRAVHDVYPFLQDKNIEVSTQIDPVDAAFFFEAEQIEQVLVNLLENSCKFTQRDGSIEIHGFGVRWDFDLHQESELRDDPDSISNAYRIDIIDTGIGVPEHLVEKVFEQYASYSGSLDRSGGGFGLAICKLVITAHGGAIWATPRENGGHFSFVLPLNPLGPGIRTSAVRSAQKPDLTLIGSYDHEHHPCC